MILICCALAVFLLSTSYWGDRLVDKYITPAFAKMLGRVLITPEPSSEAVMAQAPAALPSNVESSEPERIVFELPETSWYLLQMGAYADPESLLLAALSVFLQLPMRIRKACCRYSSRCAAAVMRTRLIPSILTGWK